MKIKKPAKFYKQFRKDSTVHSTRDSYCGKSNSLFFVHFINPEQIKWFYV